jgi:hypothetical protein
MDLSKSDWYIILFFLLAFIIISLIELGYVIFALALLFPAVWLCTKGFEKEKPSDRLGFLLSRNDILPSAR